MRRLAKQSGPTGERLIWCETRWSKDGLRDGDFRRYSLMGIVAGLMVESASRIAATVFLRLDWIAGGISESQRELVSCVA